MKKKSWYFFEGLCWSLLLLFCNVFSGRYWWIVMFFLMWEFLDIYHPSLHAVAEQTLCDFKGGFEVCQAWLSWLYWVCNTSVQLLVLDVGNRDWGLEIKQYLGNFQNHTQHGERVVWQKRLVSLRHTPTWLHVEVVIFTGLLNWFMLMSMWSNMWESKIDTNLISQFWSLGHVTDWGSVQNASGLVDLKQSIYPNAFSCNGPSPILYFDDDLHYLAYKIAPPFTMK